MSNFDEVYKSVSQRFVRDRPLDEDLFVKSALHELNEGYKYYKCFRKKLWKDVVLKDRYFPITKAFEKSGTLAFFSPLGVVYFLPAFLCYLAEYDNEKLFSSLKCSLTPAGSERALERQGIIASIMTESEVKALKDSLVILSSNGVSSQNEVFAQELLSEYWGYM